MANSIERARQFMPFAALRGYYELLAQRERLPEPRRCLPEEEAERLSQRLSRVQRGMLVQVTWYQHDAYVKLCGVVSRVDLVCRTLWIIKTPVPFDDILAVEGEGLEDTEEGARSYR